MCLKYEKEYQVCFDHLFFRVEPDESLIMILERHYGATIQDDNRFAQILMDALNLAHEEKVMTPAPPDEKSDDMIYIPGRYVPMDEWQNQQTIK